MSQFADSKLFRCGQPANLDTPQKIPDFVKPAKANGWLVRGYTRVEQRTAAISADPHKYRDWSPDRVVKRSIVDPRFDVTLPAIKWLDGKR